MTHIKWVICHQQDNIAISVDRQFFRWKLLCVGQVLQAFHRTFLGFTKKILFSSGKAVLHLGKILKGSLRIGRFPLRKSRAVVPVPVALRPSLGLRGGLSELYHSVLVTKMLPTKQISKPNLFPLEHFSAYFEQNWKPSEFSKSQRVSLNFFKSSLKLLILFRSRLTIFKINLKHFLKTGN